MFSFIYRHFFCKVYYTYHSPLLQCDFVCFFYFSVDTLEYFKDCFVFCLHNSVALQYVHMYRVAFCENLAGFECA